MGQTIRLDQGLYVRRTLEDQLLRLDLRTGQQPICLLIVGGAGAGKTSLLWRLYRDLAQEEHLTVWFFKASYLRTASEGLQRREVEPDILLRAIRSERALGKQPVILIDTVDLLLHSEKSRDFIVGLLQELKESGCQLFITSRYQEARLLESAITASHALEDYQEKPRNELQEAIHTHCQVFYRTASRRQTSEGIDHVTDAVARGLPLKTLVANPLLLRMLFSIYAPHKIPGEIHVFRLYAEYWDKKVVSDIRAGSPFPDVGVPDLSVAACITAVAMLAHGSPETDEVLWSNYLAMCRVSTRDGESLIARGVLRRSGNGTIEFFHQTFFEHSAARAVLGRFGSSSFSLIRKRVDARQTDLFVMPIYEQLLLLGELWPGSEDQVDTLLESELTNTLITRRVSGMYIYCHRRRIPDRITKLVNYGCLRKIKLL